MVSPRLKVGDVFVVPVGDGRSGVGQVVGTYGKDAFYLAIFDHVLPGSEANHRAVEALTAPVLLLALSLDAKVHAGHWLVVGQAPVSASAPLPAYKEAIGMPPRIEVVDYSGERRRVATDAEVATLPNRKVVAPIRLEKALRAALGLEPWLDAFDGLKADSLITTDAMFGDADAL